MLFLPCGVKFLESHRVQFDVYFPMGYESGAANLQDCPNHP